MSSWDATEVKYLGERLNTLLHMYFSDFSRRKKASDVVSK